MGTVMSLENQGKDDLFFSHHQLHKPLCAGSGLGVLSCRQACETFWCGRKPEYSVSDVIHIRLCAAKWDLVYNERQGIASCGSQES